MSVTACPSEAAQDALRRIRVRGGVRMELANGPRGTFAARMHEADGYRVRFPEASGCCEAVLVNTGGGVAGGDEARFEIAAGAGATATISSVAAERVYRAHAEPARLSVSLALAAASRIDWLPQETILYAGARLVRRVDVALAADAAVTLLDILVLGRRGSGERMVDGALDDRWTIRRGDRLVHMEAVRLEGAIDAAMQRSAVGSGAHVIGTLVHVAPDTEDKLDGVRAALGACGDADVAASAWQGKLVIRALGSRSDRVRQALAAAASCLSGRRMPQVWAC